MWRPPSAAVAPIGTTGRPNSSVTWALDIWIGSPDDRGRGLGAELMKLALDRVFDQHGAEMVVIDPAVDNRRAIAFYERLGFERVGVREFGGDECLVMRLLRSSTD